MTELHRQVNPRAAGIAVALALIIVASTERTEAQEGPEEAVPAAAPAGPTPRRAPTGEETDRRATTADDQLAGGELGETQEGGGTGETIEADDTEDPLLTTTTESDEGTDEDSSRFPYDHFGHRLQGGIGFIAGTGYQFEIAYGGDKCRTADGREESVCHHRAPAFFDFMLSFGATESLEILAEFRLGMLEETYFDGLRSDMSSRPMAAGLGLRYLVSPMNRFKFFVGALLDIDFTSGLDVDVYLRPIFGVQIEIVRWVGFFIQGSVNLSFIRYFGISLDGAGGFQFRFP